MLQLVPQAVAQDAGPFTFPGARIEGVGDITQFIVKAASTQTNNLVEIQDNAGDAFVTITAAGIVTVFGTTGYDVTPGSDIDTDLITVNVGGTPRMFWDESENVISNTHGIRSVGGYTDDGSIVSYNTAISATSQMHGVFVRMKKTAGASDENTSLFGVRAFVEIDDADQDHGYFYGGHFLVQFTNGTIGAGGAREMAGFSGVARQIGGTITGDFIGAFFYADQNAGTITSDGFAGWFRADFDGTVDGTAYILYLQEGSNLDYALYHAGSAPTYFGGKLGVGVVPTAQLSVDQASTTASIPVALFDQADISEEMFEFVTTIGVGNPIEAIGVKTLTTTHFIKVTIPGGLTRYFPVGTIA